MLHMAQWCDLVAATPSSIVPVSMLLWCSLLVFVKDNQKHILVSKMHRTHILKHMIVFRNTAVHFLLCKLCSKRTECVKNTFCKTKNKTCVLNCASCASGTLRCVVKLCYTLGRGRGVLHEMEDYVIHALKGVLCSFIRSDLCQISPGDGICTSAV